MDHDSDPVMESMMESLARADRSEPDADFERRMASGAMLAPTRRPGRRRNRAALAGLGTVCCALVAVAVLVVPGRSGGPTGGTEGSVSIEELSLSLFDDTFGLGTEFALSAPDGDSVSLDPAAMLDDWIQDGDAL